jgi:hypothetical protein
MMLEENLEHLFARDPYNQMGGYLKRCMGLNLYFKVENPHGQRIQELYIAGKKLNMDQTYRAAYVTSQGVPSNYGKKRDQLDVTAVEALLNYLSRNQPLKAELQGTVITI